MGKMRVRIELSARNLTNQACALRGTSDPYAIVFWLPRNQNEPAILVGKTEVIQNSLDPCWTSHFDVDYDEAESMQLKIGIFDQVKYSGKEKQHKPMGSRFFDVRKILSSRGQMNSKKLQPGGTLFCRVTPAPLDSHGMLKLDFKGVDFKKNGAPRKANTFFVLSSRVEAGSLITWQPVYRSNTIRKDANPIWPEFVLDFGKLCSGDLDRPVQLTVFSWDKLGKHKPIGLLETTVRVLLNSTNERNILILQNSKLGSTEEIGKIVVTTATLMDENEANAQDPAKFSWDFLSQDFMKDMMNPDLTDTMSDMMSEDLPVTEISEEISLVGKV